jgi:hypothetical protein
MSPQESLDHVASLLGTLPGIVVEKKGCAEGVARLWMRVTSLDSLALIVRDMTFANGGPCDVHYIGPPGRYGDESEAHKLQFRLAFSTAGSEADPPSTLQIFGIFLARQLKAAGLVSPQYADDLQGRWNGAIM